MKYGIITAITAIECAGIAATGDWMLASLLFLMALGCIVSWRELERIGR